MRDLLLPFFFVGTLAMTSLSSCSIFGEPEGPKYPDTLILATKGSFAEVQFMRNDSMYDIVRYWTDDNGQWLYKLQEEPYKHGRLHGKKIRWNHYGDTLHFSVWQEGIPRDSMLEFYEDKPQQPRQVVYFRSNGNKDYEVFFHPNGKARTDTILYIKGLREGPISFYDSFPANRIPSETYFYKNDKLIGVKIYNKQYDQMESKALALSLQIIKDSIAAMAEADRLRLTDTAEVGAKNVKELSKTKNQDYKGNSSGDVDAEVW